MGVLPFMRWQANGWLWHARRSARSAYFFQCFGLTHFITIADSAPTITALRDPGLHQALQQKLDPKTKPLGSLGRIEALVLQIGEVLGSQAPALVQPKMVAFAADHGLTARGVSAFPSIRPRTRP